MRRFIDELRVRKLRCFQCSLSDTMYESFEVAISFLHTHLEELSFEETNEMREARLDNDGGIINSFLGHSQRQIMSTHSIHLLLCSLS